MPLLFGMIPALDNIVTGGAALFGSLFGLLALMFYAVWNQVLVTGEPITWSNAGYNFQNGFYNTFYLIYDWPSFTVGLVGSVVGVLLYVAFREAYYAYTRKSKPTPEHLQVNPYLFEKKSSGAVPLPGDDDLNADEAAEAKTIAVL